MGRRQLLMDQVRRYTFPPSHRLRKKAEFSAVFDAKVSELRGPLVIYARPNALGHARLGIVIGRRVGTAARRNRIKRLVREAFRLIQHDLPGAYDLVIVIRPHEPMEGTGYRELLLALAMKLHSRWEKSTQRDQP